jgi:peptidoglycan/LPS O-acetylase OafA/YrhL
MRNERLNELDLFRFLAALGVVLYHYAFRGAAADGLTVMKYPALLPALKYGHLGVQFFFIISGFVILMTASRGGARRFLASRVARLYPAFWTACTLTFLVLLLAGQPLFQVSFSQYLANLTMFGNYLRVEPLDGVYWTLFVEMRFYAWVFLVLALGKIHRAQSLLLVWLAVTVAMRFVHVPVLQFLTIDAYAPYFIGGALLYLIGSRGFSWVRTGALGVAWALSVWYSVRAVPGLEAYYHAPQSRVVTAALVTLFYAVMLLAALGKTGLVGRMNWVALGALTYPLYLLHQNIGYVVFNALYSNVNRHVLFWGMVALMLALSYAVHILVERRLAPRLRRLIEPAGMRG